MGLGVALTLWPAAEASAQVDTTRRATSEQRIPVRKEQGTDVTRRESGGEVRLTTTTRIDSLEAVAESYRSRIDALEAANASLTSRLETLDRTIAALNDSLRMVRGELATARGELTTMRGEITANATRTASLADSLHQLNQRFILFRNRSLFGNSGIYVGLATGPNYTASALSDLGYIEGAHVAVPIGWHKQGSMLGARLELAWQNFDGRTVGTFANVDPNIYSALGLVTLHFPFNAAKTHNIYLMGGGGMYMFRDFQNSSALAAAFAGSQDAEEAETKWGLSAGVGVEFKILGATSLFGQTSFNTVSADQVVAPATSRNFRWVPLVIGVMVR
jgi:hypothetical protein